MEPDRGFLSDEFYNMPGLGALYSRASTYIFGDWNKCGELMGLAPYGRREQVKHLLELTDGTLHVPHWTTDFKQPYVMDSGSWEGSPSMRHWEDLAWRVQDDTENVLLARARWLRETTGAKNLCIAGGVALNCVANGRVARESGFENVWIQPAAGDDGIAIGCAYYGYLEILKQRRSFVMDHSYVGKRYTDQDIDNATGKFLVRIQTSAVRSDEYLPRDRKTARRAARDRLVSGRLRVRTACARQSQPACRPAQGRDEGYPEQPRQAPAGVSAVRADRAGRTGQGGVRRRGGFAVHADRQARPPRMAGQDSGDRPCRRNGAGSNRSRGNQSGSCIACSRSSRR